MGAGGESVLEPWRQTQGSEPQCVGPQGFPMGLESQRSVHWGGLLTLQPCSVWASWGPTDRVKCWPGTRVPGESPQGGPVHEHCQDELLKFSELIPLACFVVKRMVEGAL